MSLIIGMAALFVSGLIIGPFIFCGIILALEAKNNPIR